MTENTRCQILMALALDQSQLQTEIKLLESWITCITSF